MVKLLQDILGYIETFFIDFFDNILLLGKGIGLLGEAIVVPFEFFDFLPNMLVVGVSSVLAIGIIKFLLGR